MKIKTTIEQIRQNGTTTKPTEYCLSIEAVGSRDYCEKLIDWIASFGTFKVEDEKRGGH
jgi:hypothetical protein